MDPHKDWLLGEVRKTLTPELCQKLWQDLCQPVPLPVADILPVGEPLPPVIACMWQIQCRTIEREFNQLSAAVGALQPSPLFCEILGERPHLNARALDELRLLASLPRMELITPRLESATPLYVNTTIATLEALQPQRFFGSIYPEHFVACESFKADVARNFGFNGRANWPVVSARLQAPEHYHLLPLADAALKALVPLDSNAAIKCEILRRQAQALRLLSPAFFIVLICRRNSSADMVENWLTRQVRAGLITAPQQQQLLQEWLVFHAQALAQQALASPTVPKNISSFMPPTP